MFKPALLGEGQTRCGQRDAKVKLCSGDGGGFLRLPIKEQAGRPPWQGGVGQETAGRHLGRLVGHLSSGCLGG